MLQTVPPPDETLGNTTDRDESGPNFSKVSGMQLADLRDRLFKRLVPDSYAKDDRSKFDEDLKRIQAMNTVVQWGIIDSALNEELLWRNRQLQEFLIARWLSSYASPDDSRSLELYLPHDPATDAYYWIWRFTTEMPDQHQLPEKHPSVLQRVGRGGCWHADAWRCRAAIRNAYVPRNRFDALGFHLARSSVK